MAVALQSQGTLAENVSAATTLNVPYPATLDANSWLVLFVSVTNATPATLPAGGWTSVKAISCTGNTASPSILLAIKQATGSETGSLAITTPNNVSLGQMLAFSGVDPGTPQDAAATQVDQTALATTPIPGLTTTRAGVALVYGAAFNGNTHQASPPTSPATFTETADRTASTRDATSGYLIWGSSGATGTVTVTWPTPLRSVGALLALRPILTQSPADTEALTDSTAAEVSKAITDNGPVTDTVALDKATTTTDAEGLSDSLSLAKDAPLSDTEALTDTVARDVATAATDSLALTDSLTISLNGAITEDIGLTDLVALSTTQATSDLLGLTDAVTVSVIPQGTPPDVVDIAGPYGVTLTAAGPYGIAMTPAGPYEDDAIDLALSGPRGP